MPELPKQYLSNGTKLTATRTIIQQANTVLNLETAETYVPKDIELTLNVRPATPAFKGGDLSATTNYPTMTSSTVGLSTTVNGIAISANYSVDRAAIKYDGAVSGWVTAANNAAITLSASNRFTSTITRYLTSVTVPTNNSFSVINSGALTITSASSPAGTVTINVKPTSNSSGTTSANVVENGIWKTTNVTSANTYYGRVVVPSTTLSFTNGTLTSMAADLSSTTRVTASTTTNNSGASIVCRGYAGVTSTTYSNTAGFLAANTNTTISGSAISQTNWTGSTYYINGVQITAGSAERTFTLTVPNGSSTISFVFHVATNGNVVVRET